VATKKAHARARARGKSGNQLMHELPIAHLSTAQRRDLLIELIDCFREGYKFGTDKDVYLSCVSEFEKAGVDVTPADDE